MFFVPLSRIILCITEEATTDPEDCAAPRPQDPAPHRTDLRLGRIVRLLMDHATVVVSGTKIADEIGTGRSEVWRLVQQLRALGVEIAGHPATGYQLKAVPDLLLPDMLAPALKGTIFGADVHRNYHHYYKVGSTNVEAMESACRGRAGGQRFRGGGANRWAGTRRASMAISAFGGDLLLGSAAPGVAAFGGAGAFAGSGTRGAFRGAAD